MVEKARRLTQRPDGYRITFSTHLFFFISLVYGVAFVMPPDVFNTHTSPLYLLAPLGNNDIMVMWGVCLIVVCVATAVMLLTRNRLLAQIVGVAGFCLWFWAGVIYCMDGYWFGMLSVALPNVLFWAWFSIIVSYYRKLLLG